MNKYLKIDPIDNVEISISADNDIPIGHKRALCNIRKGEDIIKYGSPIGHAIHDICCGSHIDDTNIATNLNGITDFSYSPEIIPVTMPISKLKFLGYERANGEVGARNEIWVIPTVGCVNGIAQELANRFTALHPDIVIRSYTHNYGCSQLGDDHQNTKLILRNIVQHPNAGGVLVVGLGCENNQVETFKELIGAHDPKRIKFMITQECDDEIESGLSLLSEIYETCRNDYRTPIDISRLKIGVKCGGSDGLSGITANPLVGKISEILVANGSSIAMTEVPEMFGAEQILATRCESIVVYERFINMINDFKRYYLDHGEPIGENPSPGNKKGGISTLEEKSLGCIYKIGHNTINDILPYGGRITHKGVTLISGPGNDLVASTLLAAAGCHIVLFTTGRGTPFGTVVPTLKISTNTCLQITKPHWIDFNAGSIIDGQPISEVTESLLKLIIDVASGQQVNNEKNGYSEIAIFKTGVTL
jgi:altronate hydrolase